MCDHGAMEQEVSIPILDLSEEEDVLLEKLRHACEVYGFFYITNHGLESDIEQLFQSCKEFFQLSHEEKMKLAINASGHGYVWHGEETLDPQKQQEADTKENFQFGEEESGSEPSRTPLRGPNVWPSESLLPGWRQRVYKYYNRTAPLAMRICGLIATSLGLDRGYFEDKFTEPLSLVALNHYSERRSSPDDGVFGCGEHSDYDIITLLVTDDVPGLEVRLKDDTFLAVQPKKNAFICNVGDTIQHLTNDRYRSAPHRVVNRSGRERFSAGLFFRPDFNCVIDCLPCCYAEDNPTRHQPIMFGQHLLNKYRSSHTAFQG
ncbi:probable iron/ascorbate oxidoreductase DDB_G0283291 [Sycon ciliatum]|uniref:probable iron/ascorbate oxidoreductase DDB_G0283291 n=1 Tax=Sycon ciliatum TaxID=27933 RepID=UPI0020AEBCA1|eukprot:scpid75837/ scgid19651/ Probable iron/ascorbate oxidoreductase DDB_G0283291